MYKLFFLTVAIALTPFTGKFSLFSPGTHDKTETAGLVFNFKNTNPANPFEPEKKSGDTWSQGWMTSAREYIRRSEYNFTWEEKLQAYCTPNRKNNLRFFYNDNGFSVEPGRTKIPIGNADVRTRTDEISYRMIPHWKVTFNLDKKQTGTGTWQVENNKALYIGSKITVQYINGDDGMRQNFIVQAPLTKKDELNINFRVKTKLQCRLTGKGLQFFHNNTNVLDYKDLKVWDANGKSLKACFKKNKTKNGYSIQADAKNAAYPITIDPLSSTPDNTPDDADQGGAFFGMSVASAGDVNGDGYSDVIIGANQYDDGVNTDEGRAFVYYGSAAGLSATPNSTPDDADQFGANFGFSVASAGDVNGDGYSDVVIGALAYNDGANAAEGRAFVYYGSAAGLSPTPNSTPDDADQAIAWFGYSVAGAGDVNGDGFSDVIIGSIGFDDGSNTNEGRAFLYFGSATGLSDSPGSTPDDADQANARFGFSVACAGDVNGDGFSDVIIGSDAYDDGANINEGRAFVYYGSATGLSGSPDSTPDDANQPDAFFGSSVASAGDVNGDGYSDVIIGAYGFDDGTNTNEGRAFVYYGSAAGLSAAPNSTPDDADQAGAYFGYSVSSAGDVNGDGYSDVIIGAYRYDDGANVDEGRAFVYHGSATGLSASPNSAPDDADQANTSFGYSVASAGDVNGDGYSDVIIGAYRYDDGSNIDEGKAFVYHGAATGLSASPNSMPDDADQSGAYFGCSVANAGDVNADGYSDVVIGASFYTDGVNANEGRAFVYYGSATGLSASPNSTPDDADQAYASFGISVACAGDVNGDGFSDVIIGAFFYSDGVNVNEGRAFVYYGSATGLSASPNSTPDDADQADAYFGYSVASAGDVNGDGYSDVVIGAYQFNDGANLLEGRAFVYYGSPTGLAASPASTPGDANQTFASFGVSVANAGDVNGDGYSDIIIGAYQFNDGANSSEGRAFVYQGNELVSNRRNNPRLYNTDLTTPINSSNFISGMFGAGLYARSFLGREKGKLVWETRLNYNAYSGTPITNSTFFTAQQATFTDMGITGIELKNLVDKIGGGRYTKMRARIKYDPVTAITGQVYSPWRNVSSIIDANNPGVLPIELISFNAAWQQKGKTVKLDFKTDKEGGICCFDIEKSSDGFNFYSIGTLQANNISGIQSYSFIDTRANAKNQYYRIKIKGITGRHVYSNIQQLQFNRATEILLFPNPTTDLLQLQLNKAYNKLNIGIFNEAGQLVYQQTLPATDQVISVPVQKLAAGKYWLHLQSAADKQVLQFVKQ